MHELLLAEATLPSPTVVLELLLKPYSLGHDLHLIRLGNPLHNSNEATPRQLAEAVFICHQGWVESQRAPYDFLLRLKMWLWRRRSRRCDFRLELLNFINYRNAANREFPPSETDDLDQPKSSPRILGCPALLRLQQFLMIKLGKTEEQAWDYPLALATLRFQAWLEEEGGCKIYNYLEAQHDAAVERELKKADEAFKEGKSK